MEQIQFAQQELYKQFGNKQLSSSQVPIKSLIILLSELLFVEQEYNKKPIIIKINNRFINQVFS